MIIERGDERAGGERNSRTHPPLDEGRAISDQTVRTGSTDRKRSIWMFDDRKSKPEVNRMFCYRCPMAMT